MALKRVLSLFTLGLLVASLGVQLFSHQASADMPSNIDGQIKTYKLYWGLKICFDSNLSSTNISATDVQNWQLFTSFSVINSGSLVAGGQGDGNVSCNTMLKQAASLWGLPDPVTFLSGTDGKGSAPSAGWTQSTKVQGTCGGKLGGTGCTTVISFNAPTNSGSKFQTAVNKYIGGSSPKYQSYFGFEDAYQTLTGICGGKITAGVPTPTQVSTGAAPIWIVGKDGNPIQAWTTTNWTQSTGKIYFGAATGGIMGLTAGNWDHPINCSDVATYLKDKNNAVSFWSNLPASIKSTWNGQSANTGGTAGGDSNQSTCIIEGIGWIICPVTTFIAKISDGAFIFLSNSFLKIDPQAFNTSQPSYSAWQIMRSIANVVFVIIFLIIIFSQLTGAGVSNYGVKKMLPRLVVAAILVNVSFFITQLAIDASNILGYGINDLFNIITKSVINTDSVTSIINGESPVATGQGFAGVAGLLLAGAVTGVALYALLSTFIPILVAAALALILILFILVARQAIVILLVVIAPLAFVAFLLPNTENMFKMWRKMLVAMLVLFPIIALVFGASTLASAILTTSFSGNNAVPGDGSNMLGQIIGAAVLVLPLFAVPILLKKSLDSIPMIGQLANRWSSKANGSLSGKVKESYRGSTMGRGSAIRKNARESYRSKKFATRIGKGGFLGTTNQVLASGIPLPGAALQANKDLKKAATSAMVKAQEEEIADARKFIENTEFDGKTLSGKQRQDLAMGRKVLDKNNNEIKGLKGEAMQKAALQMQLGGAGSWGDVQEIIKASNAANAKMPGGVDLSKFSASISAQAGASGGKDPAFSGKRIDQISQGIFNYDIAVEQAIREGKYTAAAFAGMHDDARAEAIRVARAKESAGDSSLVEALRFAAEGVRSSPEISGSIAGNVTAQDQMQELLTTAPAAQTTPNGGLQIAHGAQQVHTAAQQSQQTNTPPQNTPPNTPSNSNTPPTP